MNSRNKPYAQALQRLSARTGTPLASLVVSFGILHEVTALVPLVGVFFGARAVGAGDRAVGLVPVEWVSEGEEWAARIGRRYGVFGYDKRRKSDPVEAENTRVALAGDVANAVLAYAVTKASNHAAEDWSFVVPCPWLFEAGVGSRKDAHLARTREEINAEKDDDIDRPTLPRD